MNTSKLGPFTVTYRNSEEFHRLKQETFTQDLYYFESENPAPVIIDAGAHIGLATLYFKKLYPAAQITALEPFAENVVLLEENIFQNQLEDVTVHAAALSDHTGTETFYFDNTDHQWWSTASFLPGAWTGSQQSDSTQVPTITLASLLTQPVDFLKMDIEGAEYKVLHAAQEHLHKIKQLALEFHPHANQNVSQLVELLENTGFKVELFQKGKAVPLTKRMHGLVHLEATQFVKG